MRKVLAGVGAIAATLFAAGAAMAQTTGGPSVTVPTIDFAPLYSYATTVLAVAVPAILAVAGAGVLLGMIRKALKKTTF